MGSKPERLRTTAQISIEGGGEVLHGVNLVHRKPFRKLELGRLTGSCSADPGIFLTRLPSRVLQGLQSCCPQACNRLLAAQRDRRQMSSCAIQSRASLLVDIASSAAIALLCSVAGLGWAALHLLWLCLNPRRIRPLLLDEQPAKPSRRPESGESSLVRSRNPPASAKNSESLLGLKPCPVPEKSIAVAYHGGMIGGFCRGSSLFTPYPLQA